MARFLIDKDDLISEVDLMIFETGYEKEELMERIESLEVIEERKTGTWIVIDRDEKRDIDCAWKCSECNNVEFGRIFINHFKYCPKCGAKMEVDE